MKDSKESAYPFACLLMGTIVVVVASTASSDRELALAGFGFGGQILASGGTAYHWEQKKREQEDGE